jgi:hypothetical protein
MSTIALTQAQIKELPVETTVYRTLITTDGNLIAVHIRECRIIGRDGTKRYVYVETGCSDCFVPSDNYSLADLGSSDDPATTFLTLEDAKNFRTEVFDGKQTNVVNTLKALFWKMDDSSRSLYLKLHWK